MLWAQNVIFKSFLGRNAQMGMIRRESEGFTDSKRITGMSDYYRFTSKGIDRRFVLPLPFKVHIQGRVTKQLKLMSRDVKQIIFHIRFDFWKSRSIILKYPSVREMAISAYGHQEFNLDVNLSFNLYTDWVKIVQNS